MATRTSPSPKQRVTPLQGWEYLESRPHPWRRQLYLKDSRLRAFTVWMDMLVNHEAREEAAQNWDLPVAAIDEIVRYCEAHQELLSAEADEEARRLHEAGVELEPPHSR